MMCTFIIMICTFCLENMLVITHGFLMDFIIFQHILFSLMLLAYLNHGRAIYLIGLICIMDHGHGLIMIQVSHHTSEDIR